MLWVDTAAPNGKSSAPVVPAGPLPSPATVPTAVAQAFPALSRTVAALVSLRTAWTANRISSRIGQAQRHGDIRALWRQTVVLLHNAGVDAAWTRLILAGATTPSIVKRATAHQLLRWNTSIPLSWKKNLCPRLLTLD
jgi:hypothetical protein